MPQYVVLLRGINVGGHGKLPMAQLRGVLEGIGSTGVATYIQSGNAVLRHGERQPARLQKAIAEAVKAAADLDPEVLVLRAADLRQAMDANPFPDAAMEQEGKALHLSFLAAKPKAFDPEPWEAAAGPGEAVRLIGRVLYLYAPQGLSRSKLAPRVERWLGVPATSRNWRTVTKLRGMLG